MPDVVVQNDPNWAEIAVVVLTLALAVAAIAAALQVNRQIRQAQMHHDEQLRFSLRPLVVVSRAECLVVTTSSPQVRVKAWLQNVGPGPALQIRIHAWLRVPDAGWDNPAVRVTQINNLKGSVDLDAPDFTARYSALGGSSSPQDGMLVAEASVGLDVNASGPPILIYMIWYQDTFENNYPRKPSEQWDLTRDLGHIEVIPLGTLGGFHV